jgi:hypothetical protein
MKYYPKSFFIPLVTFNALAIIVSIVVAYLLYILSGLAGVGAPDNYTEKVIAGILPPTLGILGFLLFSIIVLFLQQKKNSRFGYLMLILAPFDLYIFYKIFSYFPVSDFIITPLRDPSQIASGIIWLIMALIMLSALLIPFYVLIRLIKEDLFKKR